MKATRARAELDLSLLPSKRPGHRATISAAAGAGWQGGNTGDRGGDTIALLGMSGWLAIGLVVIGLLAVAGVVLAFDIARGDVGGRHTMARARRILVVATDERTGAEADRWAAAQREERPELQCFVLVEPEGQSLYEAIHEVLDRERPDAIVMVRYESERESHTDTYARLKEEGVGPIDTIWVVREAAVR